MGDRGAVKQGHKVKVAAFVVLQLEVEEDQADHGAVGHVDGPGAVCTVAVFPRVAGAGDNARQAC